MNTMDDAKVHAARMQQVNATQLAEILRANLHIDDVHERENVMVAGAPGIGKSQVAEQVAHECNADYVAMHPGIEDPTVPGGFPFVVDGRACFLPFGNMRKLVEATTLTLAHLEDLGTAPHAVQAAYMQAIEARCVGEHKISPHVMWVATTNRRTDRAASNGGIIEPTKGRFCIVELVPDFEVWVREFAIPRNINPMIIAFHRLRVNTDNGTPLHFSDFAPTAELTNSPSPRNWNSVSRILRMNLSTESERACITGRVGAVAATEFCGFKRLYAEMPNLSLCISDPDNAPVPTKPDVLCALATALAAQCSIKTWPSIARYAQRLISNSAAEYAALMINDCTRRCGIVIVDTQEYSTLATGELGAMMSATLEA